MGAMYLHARMCFSLTDATSIPMGAMYIHARMFCALALYRKFNKKHLKALSHGYYGVL